MKYLSFLMSIRRFRDSGRAWQFLMSCIYIKLLWYYKSDHCSWSLTENTTCVQVVQFQCPLYSHKRNHLKHESNETHFGSNSKAGMVFQFPKRRLNWAPDEHKTWWIHIFNCGSLEFAFVKLLKTKSCHLGLLSLTRWRHESPILLADKQVTKS